MIHSLKEVADFLCALMFCTKLLLHLQVWIEELCQSYNNQVVVALVMYWDSYKGEISIRTSPIGY